MWIRKAYCLETGFSSTRVCHMCDQQAWPACPKPCCVMDLCVYCLCNRTPQDWYNTTPASAIRSWTRDVPSAPPWKNMRSPLRNIPAADDAWRIRTDPAHTFAIQGFGSGMASSGIVLLARLGVVPGRSTQIRLSALYQNFVGWCRANSKSSSIDAFTLLKFKMKTRPASSHTLDCVL